MTGRRSDDAAGRGPPPDRTAPEEAPMTTAIAPATTPQAGRPVARGPVAWRLIHAELRKVWTTNAWWIFAIAALVMTGLALLINSAQAAVEIDETLSGPPNFDFVGGTP